MSSPKQRGIRSADSPMEFTPGEFCRGALAAWIIFMLLLVCVLTVLGVLQSGALWGPPLSGVPLYLMFGIPVGGVVSAVITLVAAPVVRLIARRLSRTSRIGIHLVVHAALGVLLGLAVASIWILLSRTGYVSVFTTAFPWVTAAMCALSIVGGWVWTVRRAIHPAKHRPDPDALFEDNL